MYLALEHYHRPASVAACLERLAAPGERTALLSGGSELNAGGHEEITAVVDIQALGLDAIAPGEGTLRIGARVTLGRLRRHPELGRPGLRALVEAAAAYANVAVQNRATVGGRIASDRPDQDLPVALAALGARVTLWRLAHGHVTEETIDYPLGAAARARLAGALITEIEVPLTASASALRRFGRTAVDVPLATGAAAIVAGTVRLAANQQGPSAGDLCRLPTTERLCDGWGAARPGDWRTQARATLLGELAAHADPWAGGEYRRDLTATLLVRALASVLGEEEIA